MLRVLLATLAVVALALAVGADARRQFRPFPSSRCGHNCRMDSVGGRPGYLNTTERWFNQTVDHFSFAPTSGGESTFQQRYLTYDGYHTPGGPIFFYTGNEGNVELYANASGLMWEHAPHFGALIVFAEHRYYGKSLLFDGSMTRMEYLTSQQALADYAVLLQHIRKERGLGDVPVIAFGGSYGGMLSSWFRMSYPGAVDGAIAASAPIMAFAGMDSKHASSYWDSETYWAVVTRDASKAGGATDSCAKNVRAAFDVMLKASKSRDGLDKLSSSFKLCSALKDEEEGMELILLVQYAFDTMAMGNFPYPSSYLTGGAAMLPAFPVRAACDALAHALQQDDDMSVKEDNDWKLVSALAAGAAVYTNVTTTDCLTLPEDVEEDGIWDYQWCTEMLPQETYFATDGVNDMFLPLPYNQTSVKNHCESKYHVTPREGWIAARYGGWRGVMSTSVTNIVFSNGLLDPWSAGGVRKNISESVVAIEIPLGAHHLDLMFSDENDPPCVTAAREFEIEHVAKWIKEANHRNARISEL